MSSPLPEGEGLPARVLVANVNGLHSPRKRHHLFHTLGEGRWDVALVVETHCEGPDMAAAWMQEGAGPGLPWPGTALWCHGTRRARGVCILFRAGFAVRDARVDFQDTDGRVLRVSWSAGASGDRWAVVAVYAPVDPQQRPGFYAPAGPFALALAAGHGSASRCLVGGDFNCVTSPTDHSGPLGGGGGRLRGGADLLAAMAAAGLGDAWGHLHPSTPGATMFTHVASTPAGPTMARLDRWLVSQDLLGGQPWVRAVRVLSPGALPGDHMAVDMRLAPPHAPPPRPGVWSLRCELVQSPAFRSCMTAAIAQHLQLPYADPVTRWEGLKTHAKATAVAFQRQLGVQRRHRASALLHAELVTRRAFAAAPADAPRELAWRSAAHRARRHHEERSRAAFLATEAAWAKLGESGTAWFHRLGRARPQRAPILSLAHGHLGAGGPVHSPAQVLQGLAAFFDGDVGGLFCMRAVDPAAQQVLLDSVDVQLSPAQAAVGEGPTGDGTLTAEEVFAALQTMKGGRCPGLDGLPYEWYAAFWSDGVGDALVAALNHSFTSVHPSGSAPLLPSTVREGMVALLHKGGTLPRDDPASYRPITLLNCDHKLLAKALVRRWSPLADLVVDPTQSAFVPGRWIGDNILFHLEEIDYCAATQQPGLILFLDWAKAYDRLDHAWVLQAMARLGFSGASLRWAGIMMRGITGRVLNGGSLSPPFSVRGGLPQGSPLSPLLYLLAVQPLASRLRQLQRSGVLAGIPLPGGGLAPPSMQHADDTSLHVPHVRAARTALEEAVQPFARASGSALSPGKLKGLMLGPAAGFTGRIACLGGAFFPPASDPVRHLGVLLSAVDPAGAAAQLFQARRKVLYARVTQWATHALSYPGRLHVAKSVLAAGLYFHASFVPPPDGLLASLCDVVDHYTFRGCLAHGCDPPARGRPGDVVESLPKSYGGLGRADVRAQITAMHAKVVALLLHPRRQPWKQLMAAAFERAFPGLGVGVLPSVRGVTAASRAGQVLGARRLAYLRAFRRTHPHRLLPLHAMGRDQVRVEPLTYNLSVAPPGARYATALPLSLPGTCSRVGELWDLGSAQASTVASAVVEWLPPAWASTLHAPAPAVPWAVSTCGGFARSAEGAVHVVCRDGRLGAAPAPGSGPVPESQWEPACVVFCGMPGEPAPLAGAPVPLAEVSVGVHPAPSGRATGQAYLVGPWAGVRVDPSLWGYGRVPITHFVVRRARERMVLLAAQEHVVGWVPAAGVPPRGAGSLERDARFLGILARRVGSGARSGAAVHGQAVGQLGRRGCRRPREVTECEPLFVAPWFHRPPKRAHVLDRVAARVGGGGSQSVRGDDTFDALQRAAPASTPPPWRASYAALWGAGIPRHLSHFGWQLLHEALPCRARLVAWGGGTLAEVVEASACSAGGCLAARGAPSSLETLEHALVSCPAVAPAWGWARRVWAQFTGAAMPDSAGALLGLGSEPWLPVEHGLRRVWLLLRLAVLHSIWVLRCARERGRPRGPQFGPCEVLSAACAQLHACIRVEWELAGLARWAAAPAGSDQARGQQAALTAFRLRWCARRVFAAVEEGQSGPRLVLVLAPTSGSAHVGLAPLPSPPSSPPVPPAPGVGG